uniref:Uncharacterized protein n=1 Tax=Phocoena sinus TaxID=42100 RepID=A0A8C9C874_PHOSS
MSSMAWPCSSRCSISMSSFTPSTTICTSSTSEKPKRSALETSKIPPTAAVSTPPGETARSAGLGGGGGGGGGWAAPAERGVRSPTIHALCEQELVSPPPPRPTPGSVCVTQHLTDSPRGSGWERRENKQLQLPRGGWRRKANTTAPPTSKILRG